MRMSDTERQARDAQVVRDCMAGEAVETIAARYTISVATAYKILRAAKVSLHAVQLAERDAQIRAEAESGVSVADLAQRHQLKPATIYLILKRARADTEPQKKRRGKNPQNTERDAEISARHTQGESISELAKVFELSVPRVAEILRLQKQAVDHEPERFEERLWMLEQRVITLEKSLAAMKQSRRDQ